jgi:hypothetical protein
MPRAGGATSSIAARRTTGSGSTSQRSSTRAGAGSPSGRGGAGVGQRGDDGEASGAHVGPAVASRDHLGPALLWTRELVVGEVGALDGVGRQGQRDAAPRLGGGGGQAAVPAARQVGQAPERPPGLGRAVRHRDRRVHGGHVVAAQRGEQVGGGQAAGQRAQRLEIAGTQRRNGPRVGGTAGARSWRGRRGGDPRGGRPDQRRGGRGREARTTHGAILPKSPGLGHVLGPAPRPDPTR